MKRTGFIFYFFYFAANACLLPFIVLYYQELGFSGVEIGLLTAIGPIINLVGAPFWTGVADATRRHRRVMTAAILAAIVLIAIFPFLRSLAPIFFAIVMVSFFTSPIGPLADSAVMHMLGGQQENYGRVRLGGTIGWGLAAPAIGALIQVTELRLAFWGFSSLMLIVLLVSQRFEYPAGSQTPAESGSNMLTDARRLLNDRRWGLFLMMAFVSGIGFASINNYVFAYMQAIGASQTVMGVALTLATMAEVPVMFFSDRLLKRLGSLRLLLLGMAATALRLLLYGALPTPAGVLIFQPLNGLTFATVWVAGVSYANQIAPDGFKSTAQGLFGATVFGFGTGAGAFFGGVLLGAVGGQMMYLIMALVLFSGLAASSLLLRRELQLAVP